MAHGFAKALEVSPWQGLITAVHIAAGRVAWIEQKLATAECDEDLMPEGRLWHWVRQAELWHRELAKTAKMAIDAGVAERLVKQVELEAEMMLRATRSTFLALGMTDSQIEHALGIMSEQLLELESAKENQQILELLE